MNVIGCKHKLKWPLCRETFLPESVDPLYPEKTTVITFARYKVPVYNILSTGRFCQPISGDVLFSYWHYTPLVAHLLWDVVHILFPGACIYLQVSDFVDELIGGEYYRAFLSEDTSTSLGLRVFRKISSLPVEQDRGLAEDDRHRV